MTSIVKQLDHGKSKEISLNDYLIYLLTGEEIFNEGTRNVQFSSYNISPARA